MSTYQVVNPIFDVTQGCIALYLLMVSSSAFSFTECAECSALYFYAQGGIPLCPRFFTWSYIIEFSGVAMMLIGLFDKAMEEAEMNIIAQ